MRVRAVELAFEAVDIIVASDNFLVKTRYLCRSFCIELLVVLLLLIELFDFGGGEILQSGVFLPRCVGAFGLAPLSFAFEIEFD